MKLKELKEKLDQIPPEFDDARVFVDTEARCFNIHMVDVYSVSYDDLTEFMGREYKQIVLCPEYDNSYTIPDRVFDQIKKLIALAKKNKNE